ncbi:MAG: 2-phospho-L-lactate transferase [Chloroflexi bacterium RBG_19FT_COMBO_62_14]|nr:MAG: 2-phospho-L-lactate transferase [Chloroflexi bacterium RBG_19FT_COMBO_62_14]
MRVVALAGGVGGAKLVDGLARITSPADLTVIVNTGDDFEHLGLWICPDMDTVVYTLAGLANPDTGWGRNDETWNFLETLSALGGPAWFRLGDRDLALSVERTRRLESGEPLSSIADHFCEGFGVSVQVLPMTDDRVATLVLTVQGELPFQQYFVALGCEPEVRGFRFEGIQDSRPAPGVLPALEEAQLIVLCPSNPWVSLDPILAVPGVRSAIAGKQVVGVSPIVGAQAIKGPAAKMFRELGIEPSALAVAEHYRGLLSGMVIDSQDASLADPIRSLGLGVRVTQTIMRNPLDRKKLAEEVLALAGERLAETEGGL